MFWYATLGEKNSSQIIFIVAFVIKYIMIWLQGMVGFWFFFFCPLSLPNIFCFTHNQTKRLEYLYFNLATTAYQYCLKTFTTIILNKMKCKLYTLWIFVSKAKKCNNYWILKTCVSLCVCVCIYTYANVIKNIRCLFML